MALARGAAALVLRLVPRALLRLIPLAARLGRVILRYPLPSMPVSLPVLPIIVAHVAAVVEDAALLRRPAVGILVELIL